MKVIKTGFITGCFGVNIIVYIENKIYNYLKKMRSFCATIYIWFIACSITAVNTTSFTFL